MSLFSAVAPEVKVELRKYRNYTDATLSMLPVFSHAQVFLVGDTDHSRDQEILIDRRNKNITFWNRSEHEEIGVRYHIPNVVWGFDDVTITSMIYYIVNICIATMNKSGEFHDRISFHADSDRTANCFDTTRDFQVQSLEAISLLFGEHSTYHIDMSEVFGNNYTIEYTEELPKVCEVEGTGIELDLPHDWFDSVGFDFKEIRSYGAYIAVDRHTKEMFKISKHGLSDLPTDEYPTRYNLINHFGYPIFR